MRPRLQRAVLATAVGLATCLVFAVTLRNELVTWDDWDNLTRNEHYRGLDGARLEWMFTTTFAGHYQPLSWVTLAVDYLWGRAAFGDGLDPRSYHLTNLLLHAANAALVCLIALRLLCMVRLGAGEAKPVSGADGWDLHAVVVLAALLFAWHPLRVESVAWATERRDVLSSFFLLLTVLCYLHAPFGPAARRWRWLGPALAAFVLSLLSRSLAVVLPPILLLLDWYPLRRFEAAAGSAGTNRGAAFRIAFFEKIPFFILAAVFAALAVHAQAAMQAVYDLTVYPTFARFVQTCYGLCSYVTKTAVPVGLSPIYELHLPANVFEGRYVASVVVVLAAVVVLGWLLIQGRGRWLIVAAATYGLFIVPVSGIVQSGKQEVADRYSYLPGVVFAILVAAGVLRIAASPAARRLVRGGLVVVSAGAVLMLAGLTVAQCTVWRNSEMLWADAIRMQPESSIAHCGYGTVLVNRGAYDDGLRELYRALELWPTNTQAHRQIWRAWGKQGPSHEAEYLAALRYSIGLMPDFSDAHYNLAVQLDESGHRDAAMAEYQIALEQNPTHSRAHTNLALLLKQQGRLEDAMQHFEAGALADRQSILAWRGWALLLHEQGRDAAAREALRGALQIEPEDSLSRKYLQEWTGSVGATTSSARAAPEGIAAPASPSRRP
ncbi:MAG TPA: tetratricopeptide repeat protein [Phycisphaerae bacterium]|nr:tetratricopeptide repeat protein [Phycisphaerae bacterium]